MNYDFDASFAAWSRIPVDDFDYLSAREILLLAPSQRKELIELASTFRWAHDRWRNRNGSLLQFMTASASPDKIALDFGCGFGLDAVELFKVGMGVILADLHPWVLLLANQTLISATNGGMAMKLCPVAPLWPYFDPGHKIDLFWSMGVLHHFPWGMQILRRACECLNPGGECRICLYSDKRWKEMVGDLPQGNSWDDLRFAEFARKCDAVGSWADWYNEEKLKEAVRDFADVAECVYLCDDQFIGAVIKPKGG